MLFIKKRRIVENELNWYFNQSSADIGIKSNWQAMVNVSCFGGSTTYQDPYNSFILKSVEKLRKIDKRFYATSINTQRALFLYFADQNFLFPHITRIYQELGPLTRLSDQFNNLDKICQRFLLGTASDKDKISITNARIEARTNLFSAVNEYYNLRSIKK